MSNCPDSEQVQQSAVENVSVGGNFSIGSITQIVNRDDFPKPTGFPENIPRSGTVKFVGRSQALDDLHQLLQQNHRMAITAAIAGMGGVGKTELAMRYARTHLEIYQGGVCWLLVKSGNIDAQVVQFARRLHLTLPKDLDSLGKVEYCWQHWPLGGEVLVVLDDVTDYKQVKPYLPPESSRFKVLITTRFQLGSSIKQLSLDVLKMDLLKSLVERERLKREPWVARKLCKWLGYLPLGLELVGRYLKRKKDLCLAEMLSRLEAKRLEERSLNKPKSEDDMTAQLGVLAAFELSWQELNDPDKQLGCLLSLFAPAPIPWYLVEQCLTDQDSEELEAIRDESLLNLHLLQRKSEGTYQLHQLIREFFLHKLKQHLAEAKELKQSFAAAMVAVAKKIPREPTRDFILSIAPAMAHVAEVTKEELIDFLSDEDLTSPFIGLGVFYEEQGTYDQAARWYENCRYVTQNRFGSSHLAVAESLHYLGWLYNYQGRHLEAESRLKEALELRKFLLGYNHPDVATSWNALGTFYLHQKSYREAKRLLRRALKLRKRLLDNNHPNVAVSLIQLAGLFQHIERYPEAETLYLEALEIEESLQGKKQDCSLEPDIATTLNNLATLYIHWGQHEAALGCNQAAMSLYQKAEYWCQKAIELNKDLRGDDHHFVAHHLLNLADICWLQQRYSEIESLSVKALEIFERRLGVNHPNSVTIRKELKIIRAALGCKGK